MIPIGAVLAVIVGFSLAFLFTALIGRAADIQITSDGRPYDWERDGL